MRPWIREWPWRSPLYYPGEVWDALQHHLTASIPLGCGVPFWAEQAVDVDQWREDYGADDKQRRKRQNNGKPWKGDYYPQKQEYRHVKPQANIGQRNARSGQRPEERSVSTVPSHWESPLPFRPQPFFQKRRRRSRRARAPSFFSGGGPPAGIGPAAWASL